MENEPSRIYGRSPTQHVITIAANRSYSVRIGANGIHGIKQPIGKL
jgi:hypothetical protein